MAGRFISKSLGEKLAVVLLWVAAVVATVFVYGIDPYARHTFLPCLFYESTGYYCPGCGGTRGVHFLLHFDILNALRYNLFLPLTLSVATYALVARTVQVFFGKTLFVWRPDGRLILALAIVLVLYWILRNLPFEPFIYLAPPHIH